MRVTLWPGRVRLPRTIVLLLAAAGLSIAACEVPQAPEWNVGVLIPFSSDTLGILDLLPDEVGDTVVDGTSVFTVERQADSADYSLAQMCGDPCRVLHGIPNSPVPGFDYTDSLDVSFPEKLVSIEVIRTELSLEVTNVLNFDPLRPHPDPDSAGFIAIVARDLGSGSKLDSVFISGANETFPPGESKRVALDVTDATLTEGIRTTASIHSPEDGQTTQIDTTLVLRVGSALDRTTLTALTAVVDGDSLNQQFVVALDSELRDEIDEHVRDGAFELWLRHNFDITGSLDVSLAGSPDDLFSSSTGTEIRLDDFSLARGSDPVTRELTSSEVRFLVGLPEIYVGYRAEASGTATDGLGRPVSRFTPDEFLTARVKISTTVAVNQ